MLTAVVTKAFPSPSHVGLHLLFKDDTETIIDKDYRAQWSGNPDDAVAEITGKMQTDIDRYRTMKKRFEAAAYGTAAATVQSNLDITKEI